MARFEGHGTGYTRELANHQERRLEAVNRDFGTPGRAKASDVAFWYRRLKPELAGIGDMEKRGTFRNKRS